MFFNFSNYAIIKKLVTYGNSAILVMTRVVLVGTLDRPNDSLYPMPIFQFIQLVLISVYE